MSTLSEQEFKVIKQSLDDKGYAVIKGLLSRQEADEHLDKVWNFVEGLNPKISRNDKASWYVPKQFPLTMRGIFKWYGCGHADFMWDLRKNKKVLSFFEQAWATDELLTSFDGFSLLLPNKPAISNRVMAHTDQAPLLKIRENNGPAKEVRDFNCIQMLVNLRDCGSKDGGFVVYEGSHKGHAQFFEDVGLENHKENWYVFENPAKLSREKESEYKKRAKAGKEFLAKYKRVKVNVDAGDAIVWYSKTAHTVVPTESDNYRVACYISMLPKKYATKSELKRRVIAYNKCKTTSHWACIKFKTNSGPFVRGPERWYEEKNFNVMKRPPPADGLMKKLIGLE